MKVYPKHTKKLILSGLYLHLTFECLITFIVRDIFFYIGDESSPLYKIWHNQFETAFLEGKLNFLKNSFLLPNDIVKRDIKGLISFYQNELKPIRNKIVHGHEIAIYYKKTGPKSTPLEKLLNYKKIQEVTLKFSQNVNKFFKVIEWSNTNSIINKVISPEDYNHNISQEFDYMIKIEIKNRVNILI